jgi:hypothetical protein
VLEEREEMHHLFLGSAGSLVKMRFSQRKSESLGTLDTLG